LSDEKPTGTLHEGSLPRMAPPRISAMGGVLSVSGSIGLSAIHQASTPGVEEIRMENESPFLPLEEIASPSQARRPVLGLCGILVATIGLTLAVARPYLAEVLSPPAPPEPKPKVSEIIAEAGEKFVDRMIDKVRRRKAAAKAIPIPAAIPQPPPWPLYLSLAATSLGLIGSLSGTAGWIRREDHRMAGAAIVIGSLAVAWTYIVTALIIALVIFFLLLFCG
jgi:hypothetical protein